jgi:predicted GNAT family acetyltransferase
MEAVIAMAEAEHRLIVPICSYAVHYMNQSTKYKHLLAP